MRTYDILILGIETELGQKVFSLLEQDYNFLSVAVPLSNYSQSIRYPQNQVRINYSSKKSIETIVSSFRIIVAFNQKKCYRQLIFEAKDSFVDASSFTLQMVIDIFKTKVCISNNAHNLELDINASKSNILNFILYPKKDYLPVNKNDHCHVKIGELNLCPEMNFSMKLIFSTKFTSIFFFVLGLIFKPFILLFQLFGCVSTIPFNKDSTPLQSFLIKWQEPIKDKKNQFIDNQYFINPNQNENDVICDYILLKLINILCLQSPYDKIELKSLSCSKIEPKNANRKRKGK